MNKSCRTNKVHNRVFLYSETDVVSFDNNTCKQNDEKLISFGGSQSKEMKKGDYGECYQ